MFKQPVSESGSYQESIFSLQHSHVDPVECTISRHDGIKNVPPRLMKLLILLAVNNRKTVTREQILTELWPNTVVTDESINRAVADLRKILDDSPNTSNIIKTITKQGYKLTLEPILMREESNKFKKFAPHLAISLISVFCAFTIWQIIGFYTQNNTLEGAQYVQSRLATSGTRNRRPNINNNGNLLVSERIKNDKHSLWLYDLVTDSEKQLFSERTDNFVFPAISNDSSKLAYMRLNRDPNTFELYCKIEIYHLILETIREISDCDYFSGADLSWTQSDEQLLASQYNSSTHVNDLVFIDVQTGESNLIISPENQQTFYRLPRLSPSGKYLALLESNSQLQTSKLAIFNLSNLEMNYITTHSYAVNQVDWGEDDNVLYYSELSGVKTGLWQVDLQTQQQELVVNRPIVDFDYNVLNNTFVVSVARYVSSIKRFLKGNKSIIIDDDTHDNNVIASSDGKLLAFVSNRNGPYNIWAKSLVNDELFRVTNDENSEYLNLRFSPDGQYLSYLMMGDVSNILVILDMHNNYDEVYRQSNVETAAWSKTSHSIYTYGKTINNEIYKVSLSDFSKELVANTPDLHRIEIGPKDELIVQLTARGPLYKLCCIKDGFADPNNFKTVLDLDWIYNWNISGDELSVIKFADDHMVIDFYSIDGEEKRELRQSLTDEKSIFHYSYNSQSKTLYYSIIKNEEYSLVKLQKVAE